jgi:hypothetical protein
MPGKALYRCHPAGWEQSRGPKWRKSTKRGSHCIRVASGNMVFMIRLSRERKMMMRLF